MNKRTTEKKVPGFVSLVLPVLALILGLSGPVPASTIMGDLTGDYDVDFRDFALFAEHWLEGVTVPELRVFEVTKAGISQTQAANLAAALGISGQLDPNALENGAALFMDPNNFQYIPMTEITLGELDPNFIYDPCANEEGTPDLLEGFDFNAIETIEPISDSCALSKISGALGAAGLSLQSAQNPEYSFHHSQFSAFDVNGEVMVEDVNLDTQALYGFSLDGGGGSNIPFIGSELSATFDPCGNTTQLICSLREVAEYDSVSIITQGEAMDRYVEAFPNVTIQADPELVYIAPPVSECNANIIVPHYECRGTATEAGCDIVSVLAYIPATDDSNYVPQVELNVEVQDSNRISAQAQVTGGFSGGPYEYVWSSSTTDLSENPDINSSSIVYDIVPNEGSETVTSETVSVTVRDKEGIQVYAIETVEVNVPPPESPESGALGPLAAGRDVGTTRGVSGWLGASNQRGFDRRMWLDGVTRRFYLSGLSAWEKHFKDRRCHPGALDFILVDNVDLTFYIGHGWPGGFTFVNPRRDDRWLTCADASRYCRCWSRGGWGNKDLEWLSLLSCRVLMHTYKGDRYDRRWGPAFNGLHLLLGFHTVAYDAPGFGWTFADGMLGWPPGGPPWWRRPAPVRVAWFRAKIRRQPRGVVAAVMGVFGPRRINNYNDYFWGKGRVGPDIRCPWIRGYWWVRR